MERLGGYCRRRRRLGRRAIIAVGLLTRPPRRRRSTCSPRSRPRRRSPRRRSSACASSAWPSSCAAATTRPPWPTSGWREVIYRGTRLRPLAARHARRAWAASTATTLVAFYRRHYTLAGSALIAVGDLDPEALLREAEARFGPLGRRRGGAAGARDPARAAGRRSRSTSWTAPAPRRPSCAWATSGSPRTHPDYIPLIVLNTLLGGKFTSRINLNLRERHGYTYGASSRFVGPAGAGAFRGGGGGGHRVGGRRGARGARGAAADPRGAGRAAGAGGDPAAT